MTEIFFAQSKAEVDHDRVTEGVDKDILRLDVAVHEAALVGVVKGLGYAGNDLRRPPGGCGYAACAWQGPCRR